MQLLCRVNFFASSNIHSAELADIDIDPVLKPNLS